MVAGIIKQVHTVHVINILCPVFALVFFYWVLESLGSEKNAFPTGVKMGMKYV